MRNTFFLFNHLGFVIRGVVLVDTFKEKLGCTWAQSGELDVQLGDHGDNPRRRSVPQRVRAVGQSAKTPSKMSADDTRSVRYAHGGAKGVRMMARQVVEALMRFGCSAQDERHDGVGGGGLAQTSLKDAYSRSERVRHGAERIT